MILLDAMTPELERAMRDGDALFRAFFAAALRIEMTGRRKRR